MSKELIQKIIRCFVIGLCFLGALTIIGLPEREAQQWGFMLGLILVFGLLLKNIWLTLFLGWSVFLFSFFKFEVGLVYVTNIFFGCLLYYLVKVAFRREHIKFFINAILWFAALNIFYMALQVSNFDFIYKYISENTHEIGLFLDNRIATGFMGQKAVMGAFLSLCVPLLASRPSKLAVFGALGLFIPMCLSKASLSLWAAGIGLGFVLWYKIPKKIWFTIAISVCLFFVFYFVKIDKPGFDRVPQWKKVLSDCIRHPITGWGLDSFRNVTSYKDFRYMGNLRVYDKGQFLEWWDNPHNILISLFYEFGLVGIFLFIGYLRQCGAWFIHAVKEPDVIGLFGFMLTALLLSQAHFIMFLARTAIIVIIGFALFEVSTRNA